MVISSKLLTFISLLLLIALAAADDAETTEAPTSPGTTAAPGDDAEEPSEVDDEPVDDEPVDDEPVDDEPVDADPVICTNIYLPVKCGEDESEYTNQCEATAAGWPEDECTEVEVTDPVATDENCPAEDKDANCIFISPPPFVECGPDDCRYSTLCWAQSAGWAEDDCEPAEDEATAACPPLGDMPCSRKYQPVVCGEQSCPYDNICLAASAGYDVTQCNEAPPPPPPPTAEPGCPIFSAGDKCPPDLEPVACGEDDCVYYNQCLAEGSGYGAENCTATEETPECPEGTFACTSIYRPVLCGECRYNNICFADNAGFDIATCSEMDARASGAAAGYEIFTSWAIVAAAGAWHLL